MTLKRVAYDMTNGKNPEIHLFSRQSLANYDVVDLGNDLRPHQDVAQLISCRTWQRYSNATVSKTSVINCTMYSPNSFRNCIAGFDGLFRDILIINNTLTTKSEHVITFNGLRSGDLRNNFTLVNKTEKVPAKILLNSWRIGGGLNQSIDVPFSWVLSVKNNPRYYQPIRVSTATALTDNRGVPQNIGVNLIDFDVNKFNSIKPNYKDFTTEVAYITALREVALVCGTLYQ